MALTSKKFSSIHGLTGDNKNSIKAKFDDGYHEIAITEAEENPVLSALVYQIGQLEEEIDYLRTEISSNKDKAGISPSQANAITANTAKTGITTQQATAITDNRTEAARLDGLITTNTKDISNLLPEVAAAIKVGAYPPLGLLAPAGTTQSHTSEIVYDSRQKKYFLNIYYKEETPAKPPKKGVVTIRTGQIELK